MQVDSIKSGGQPRYKGIVHAFTTIYRTEGLKGGLYKGLSMNWIKGPIAVGMYYIKIVLFSWFIIHLKFFVL